MNDNIWQSRKVLVTGHTGFKGSWLCLWLAEMGADVIGYSQPPPTEPNLFTLAKVESGITSLIGDVRSLEELNSVVRKYNVEIIIHLAAQSLVRTGYQQPVETYSTNVMGTVNVMEVARTVESVKVVLNVTSDKCYENRELSRGYAEGDSLGGADPYSNSKACSEFVTMAYRKSYFEDNKVAVASARAGNVIGGGDWAKDRLIPDIVRALSEKKPVTIRHPDAIRPWQFVLDPLCGYIKLIEKMWLDQGGFNEPWNFGPASSDAKSVGWLLEMIEKNFEQSLDWSVDELASTQHETGCLMLDSTRARDKLGWSPKLKIDEAISWTVEWYRRYFRKDDIRKFTLNQIREYAEIL